VGRGLEVCGARERVNSTAAVTTERRHLDNKPFG